MNLQLAQSIGTLMAAFAVFMAGIGFSFSQFKQGSNKAKDDLINTLEKTAKEAREEAVRLNTEKINLQTEHQRQINELTEKVGKLQGLYESSESGKKEYLAILQGRDPAQQKFMEFMVSAVSESTKMTVAAEKYMTDSIHILSEIRVFMQDLNEKAKKSEEFQESVVVATDQGVGNVLRKET